MALNVAFPLSGLLPESLYERYALISPTQQDYEEDLELLVTPYGSSESGIGSSNDSKNPKSSSEDEETPSTASSSTSSTSSKSSTSPTSPTPQQSTPEPIPPIEKAKVFDFKIQYHGRDVLDLAKNLTDSAWKFQYARLPESNVSMFMANRSQYHRLGANGLIREYDLAPCTKCTFQFPVNSPNIIYNDAGAVKPIQQSTHIKAMNNMPSYKMYKHF